VDRDLVVAGGAAIPVVLTNGEGASGLADMLRQFLEQTLADSTRKQHQARSLRGDAVFRSAEDENVCVQIAFRGDRVELRDAGGPDASETAVITADFLTIAHLASGREGPFSLLVRRKLRARFRLRQLPFLLNVLRFMRTSDQGERARRRWLAAVVAIGIAALYWLIIA